jgi:hypothetical protein
MKLRLLVLGIFTSLFLAVNSNTLQAASVTPTVVNGNPTCVGLGYDFGFKVDPPNAGPYTVGSLGTITVSRPNGQTVNWTSTFGIDAVIIKGGDNSNVYVYDPPAESLGDTGLTPPINPNNGQPYGVSHIEFCYDIGLVVSKSAITSFNRDYDWTIAKSVDQNNLTLSPGQQHTVNYTVMVTKDAGTDSGWSVSGIITVTNPHPTQAATGVVVTDIISGIGAVPVTCPSTTIAAAGTMNCTYGPVALPSGIARTNTATATTTNANLEGGSAMAAVTFGAPTNVTDNCVNVSDTLVGTLHNNLCASQTFNYPFVINAANLRCGTNTINNVASLATDDGGTETSGATVNVNIACVLGCTLTQGYWKTHSDRGPAPYDNTWALLGGLAEDTPFFGSGKTWYQVFWTAPQGNPYYILAHQYMAAELNILNGAIPTPAVATAINSAETLLTGLNPNTNFTKAQKASMVNLAGILGSFNEGVTGPGHCSE